MVRCFKGNQKKKKRPVSDNIGISTWEISSDESSDVEREHCKKTAIPKQAMVVWTKEIKRSQDKGLRAK